MNTYEVVWTVGATWRAKRIERVNAATGELAINSFSGNERAGWKVRAFPLGEWDRLVNKHLLASMKSQQKRLARKIATYESLEAKTIRGFVPLDKAKRILEEVDAAA
jgi:hypothetical protein